MILDIALLIIALLIILGAAELFTNGIEWLGQKLGLSEGTVGSVLAAVGTALPETLIPFVAIFFFGNKHGLDVGVGAIAGAPFMLSTLTLGLCGISILLFSQLKQRSREVSYNQVSILRDLRFFVFAYTIGLAASIFTKIVFVRWIIAAFIVLIYPVYLYKTFSHEGEVGQCPETLHFDKLFSLERTRLRTILLQTLIGVGGILLGAFLFVDHIQRLALSLGLAPLFLSLIVCPIATELPEKINSIIWVRQGKDTLALGNITGALVFQSCFPVALGVAFSSWNLGTVTLTTGIIALLSAVFFLYLISKNKLKPFHLAGGSLVYLTTIICLILYQTKH